MRLQKTYLRETLRQDFGILNVPFLLKKDQKMWAHKICDFSHHKYPLLGKRNGSLTTTHLCQSQIPVVAELRGK